jgi:hypothetical protein
VQDSGGSLADALKASLAAAKAGASAGAANGDDGKRQSRGKASA